MVVPLSESEVVHVHVGQVATVTVEALEGRKFAAHVVSVAVLATNNSGVVSYNVTVSIINAPPSLKPGMTANVSVTTAEANNVLQLPSSAITATSNTTTVSVLLPTGKTAPKTVTIGLKGDTADQITSGGQ